MADGDPFSLQRFIDAQAPVYDAVVRELKNGRKTSHWMWFVFPQIAGLGFSPMSVRYAISSPEEATAYASHPVLGQRLRECTALVNAVDGRSALEVFGRPDDMKFHSSVTLFSMTAEEPDVFQTALSKYFDGKPDPQTVALLG